MQITNTDKRIESIDVLRGIVMVIMALDHVRDYFHIAANLDSPLNLETTTPLLYFTRWITHFCAPAFIFLSGISAYLQGLRKSKKELSIFLITRGFWLLVVEVVIVSFGWSFNPNYNFLFLQVIWAIGISMINLGLVIRLPFNLILGLGLLLVLGHNLLDIPESATGFQGGMLWDMLHHGHFTSYTYAPGHAALIVYPIIPWPGVMMLGYCAGVFFTSRFSAEQRKRILTRTGLGLILLFILLRFLNVYGDPHSWSPQKNMMLTFFSFLDVSKYPPSLLFLFITIGPVLVLLSFIERFKNAFTDTMRIYGRVAFFYYVLHIYLIHLIAAICFFARGHTWQDASNTGTIFPFYFVAPGEGYSLAIVYLVWIIVIITLYPLCKWYNNYKTMHKEKWWLSYL